MILLYPYKMLSQSQTEQMRGKNILPQPFAVPFLDCSLSRQKLSLSCELQLLGGRIMNNLTLHIWHRKEHRTPFLFILPFSKCKRLNWIETGKDTEISISVLFSCVSGDPFRTSIAVMV